MVISEDEAEGSVNDGLSPEGTNPYAVRSLERGLSILSCFDVAHPTRSLAELVKCSALHKATCFRLVKTLEAEGFLAADDSSSDYRLGPALIRISLLAQSGHVLARLAHPHLAALAEATGETVDLTTWSPDGPLLIDRSVTSGAFRPRNTVGQVLLDPRTSHATVWLAFGTPVQSRRALTLFTARATSQTSEPFDPEQDLDKVRRDGCAFDIGEERGVCAIGAPVRGPSGDLLACVSVVSPYRQSPTETIGDRRRALLATTAALSQELGFRP